MAMDTVMLHRDRSHMKDTKSRSCRSSIKPRVRISEVLRRALEEEVRRRKLEELEEKLGEVGEALDRIDIDRVVKSIREDREGR